MKERFYRMADHIVSLLRGDETVLLTFDGEESDFVRFNHNAVRQGGSVMQQELGIDLVRGRHHAQASAALTGQEEQDRERCARLVEELRGRLEFLPEDPHLLYATEINSTEKVGESQLVSAEEALEAIFRGGAGRDSVGIYAQGPIHRGFANSLGQRNWFTAHTFNLDWCFYLRADKAVKSDYAGFAWDAAALDRKMEAAGEQLALLDHEPKTIEPGKYRVYLSPKAVEEIASILCWGGFGLKDHKAKISSLIRMTEGEARFAQAVTISENTGEGVSPNFDKMGFVKPDQVVMIENGAFKDHLVSPRSAKEYGVATNGAAVEEYPYSLDMAAGELAQEDVLERLERGVYINNLWYLNYSDRPACRMTGMTRFATFWVEGGKLVAPLNVMRFDESAYRMLGSNLIGLTRERAMVLSAETYGGRQVASSHLPGALVEDFEFTL